MHIYCLDCIFLSLYIVNMLKLLDDKKIKECENIISYKFKNKNLLIEALTHKSFINETDKTKSHNQRLEFLGDSVLSLVITEHLFTHFHNWNEGVLSKLKASLISETTLSELSNKLSLGEFIQLGLGEEQCGGRVRDKLLEDLFEAIIGAIYLDSDLVKTKKFILEVYKSKLATLSYEENYKDYKTIFQEIVQKKYKVAPHYSSRVENEDDPEKRIFYSEVLVGNKVFANGSGKSKKRSEVHAAKKAIERIKNKESKRAKQ